MRLDDMSAPAIEAMLNEETGEVMLVFLDIAVPGGTTIRVVNNWESVTRLTEEYLSYRFEISLPNEADEGIPVVSLTIDNVDLIIIEHLLSVTEPIPVEMNVALASSPNITEAGPFIFKIVDVQWTPENITAEMTFDDVMTEVYPGYRVIPSTHPAAFAG
ncbi:MAG: DUF1833 family protein [Candidatus Peribacteraceae bacterium]|nr:DUF1833 family protein [Candidatus Peribacteraceae bacterium]